MSDNGRYVAFMGLFAGWKLDVDQTEDGGGVYLRDMTKPCSSGPH